jgi:AcrR family transcriptional regulator
MSKSNDYYFGSKEKALREYYAKKIAEQIEREILKKVFSNNPGIYKK